MTETTPKIRCRHVDFWYGSYHALKAVDLDIPDFQVTAFIGPSGCGKSTLLRLFNRMNDTIDGIRVAGTLELDGQPVYGGSSDVVSLRRRVGMVFQKPNPFPSSIYDNVAFGVRIGGERRRSTLDQVVEESLRAAALWDEVRDRLRSPALSLSGGQQQRLCIARALAVRPEVLLMDEPTSALDPVATGRIEALITELRERLCIVIVTHNMQQASRISDHTAFFYLGQLIEADATKKLFTAPRVRQTEDYITGRFG